MIDQRDVWARWAKANGNPLPYFVLYDRPQLCFFQQNQQQPISDDEGSIPSVLLVDAVAPLLQSPYNVRRLCMKCSPCIGRYGLTLKKFPTPSECLGGEL